MSQRSIVTDKMRAILVDWLIQVHNRFRLLQETLYITVSILDRFLSVSLNHLLLVNQNPFSKLLLLLLPIIPPLYQKSALSFLVIFVDLTVNKENQQWLEMRDTISSKQKMQLAFLVTMDLIEKRNFAQL